MTDQNQVTARIEIGQVDEPETDGQLSLVGRWVMTNYEDPEMTEWLEEYVQAMDEHEFARTFKPLMNAVRDTDVGNMVFFEVLIEGVELIYKVGYSSFGNAVPLMKTNSFVSYDELRSRLLQFAHGSENELMSDFVG